MNWKELKHMVLIMLHATEQIRGHKIVTAERVRFRKGLRGAGEPIDLGNGCGRRSVQLFARREKYLLRINLSVEASRDGCIEEAKQWMLLYKEVLETFARQRGRRHLPLEVAITTVAADGTPTNFEGKVSLDRGG